MANIDNARGLVPYNMQSSEALTRMTPYYVSTGANIGIGAPVVKTGTANTVDISTLSGQLAGFEHYKAGQLPVVAHATAGAGNAITGVVVAVARNPAAAGSIVRHKDTAVDSVVYVNDDPDTIYEMQCDGTLAATDIASGFDFAGTSLDTDTGNSTAEIDSTSAGTGGTEQLKVLRVSPDPNNNDISSANCNFLVKITNHTESNSNAGI